MTFKIILALNTIFIYYFKITLMNSQHKPTNSNGYFIVKIRVIMVILKVHTSALYHIYLLLQNNLYNFSTFLLLLFYSQTRVKMVVFLRFLNLIWKKNGMANAINTLLRLKIHPTPPPSFHNPTLNFNLK